MVDDRDAKWKRNDDTPASTSFPHLLLMIQVPSANRFFQVPLSDRTPWYECHPKRQRDHLYVVTHPQMRDQVETRCRGLLAAFDKAAAREASSG